MKRIVSPRNGFIVIVAVALLGVFAVAAVAMAGGNDDEPSDSGGLPVVPGEPDVDDAWDVVQEPAPIESVGDVVVGESDPEQYFLSIVSAQPNGCHQFDGHTVERAGKRVIVTVNNNVPADLTVVLCTMEFKTTETNVNLGSDFESGESYVIEVNGQVAGEFTAQ
jgi:hypothetical protein